MRELTGAVSSDTFGSTSSAPAFHLEMSVTLEWAGKLGFAKDSGDSFLFWGFIYKS